MGYSPWDRTQLNTTERMSTYRHPKYTMIRKKVSDFLYNCINHGQVCIPQTLGLALLIFHCTEKRRLENDVAWPPWRINSQQVSFMPKVDCGV